MGFRNNFHREQLEEHIERRGWTKEDKDHFFHMIGHSALMSEQGVLSVLEYQQATDERIAAEEQCDEVFGATVVPIDVQDTLPLDFFRQRFTEGSEV